VRIYNKNVLFVILVIFVDSDIIVGGVQLLRFRVPYLRVVDSNGDRHLAEPVPLGVMPRA
jgi:hypothetical protein